MAKRGRPPHPDILTPREWEVHALLREGLSNEAIGERLGISLAGAKYHVSEILSKLGVASREEAAAWTREQRPWWQAGFAPLAALWRKATVSWLSIGATAIVAIAIVAGIGLLVWGLLRTGGDGGPDVPEGLAADPEQRADLGYLLASNRTHLSICVDVAGGSPLSSEQLVAAEDALADGLARAPSVPPEYAGHEVVAGCPPQPLN